MQQCKSLSGPGLDNIDGYDQYGINTSDPDCTCKAWKFAKKNIYGSRNCKHIGQARKERCEWHQQFGEPQEKPDVCPRCGGPTQTVKVGV